MGGSCNNCSHRCCVNGESGVAVWLHCELCDDFIQLCSNNLTIEEENKRCNGEACGCGDDKEILCHDCRKK